MKKATLSLLLFLLLPAALHAGQSVIIDSEGYACMGDSLSRKQTELSAMQDARRKGGESALTYIQAETQIKDAMLEKDLVNAYSNAQISRVRAISVDRGGNTGPAASVDKTVRLWDSAGCSKAVVPATSELAGLPKGVLGCQTDQGKRACL